MALTPRTSFCLLIFSFTTILGCWINVRYWLKRRPSGRLHCRGKRALSRFPSIFGQVQGIIP